MMKEIDEAAKDCFLRMNVRSKVPEGKACI